MRRAWLLSPRSSVPLTSPPWIAAVCGAYGFTAESRIAVDAAGRPVGGLAWVPVDDARGRRLLSMPFSEKRVWTASSDEAFMRHRS